LLNTASETQRGLALSAFTTLENRLLVVMDASADERFANHALVTGPPHVRFYAAAPLTTRDGTTLGSLCLIDTVARQFSQFDSDSLVELAKVAAAAVESKLTEGRLLREIALWEENTNASQLVEAKYQRIGEDSPSLTYRFVRRTDESAEFLSMSDTCGEILQLDPKLLLRDAGEYFKLIHPEDSKTYEQAFSESALTLKPLCWEGRHVLSLGETKWVQVSAQPQRMLDGSTVWDGVMRDISKRKRDDDRLRLLENAIEHANDAILITEAEPIDEPGPRIIYVNKAFTDTTGYTESEVIGKTPRILQGPNTNPETKRLIRHALERWKPVRVELINYRKDGSEFWEELNIVPVANEKGWFTHWVSVQRDITERKQAEIVLLLMKQKAEEAQAEAESANRAKSEFLSRMSHELRTPLNAILGFGQLLERSDISPKQKQSAAYIISGGRHLLDLVNEVLDISRIEAGKLELNIEPVRVVPVLEEVASLVRPLAEKRAITVNVIRAAPALEWASALVDRQRFKQVLINLISNAISYNKPSGCVDLVCERAGVDGRLRLSVRDTGPGISPEDLLKLFSPFERLNVSSSEVAGTGIGLAISKRLVEAMGGAIQVESKVGCGTTFSLELPLAESLPQNLQGIHEVILPIPAVPRQVKHIVLYIEDNFSNLRLVEAVLLERPDVQLLTSTTGRAGLELALEQQPDLILLDMHLPDLLGDELLRILKGDDRTRQIPVVMVSADATPSQIEHLLALGARTYLTKPLDISSFLRTIDEALIVEV
ncbi:MAG: two-component system sensor protein, partial [Chthoniobacteraceae bacterium]|nr:two-component system sensor protein [Chthoniobacteraceae bacterium]